MRTFKSLNDLVWWLQNNGGGRVEILATADTSDTAVTICVTPATGEMSGQGRFLKGALADLKEGA